MAVTFDDLIPQQKQTGMFDDLIPKQQTSTAGDAVKSFGTGLVEGAAGLAALPGTLKGLVQAGGDWAQRQMGLTPAPQLATPKGLPDINPPSYDQVKGSIERNITGELYQPQTTLGEYSRTVGQFAPGVMMGPGTLGQRAMTNVVAPAVASETAGQMTKGTDLEPYARFGGAVAGSFIPSAIGAVRSPFPAAPQRAQNVQILENEGVTALTAGQKTGSKPLQWAESVAVDTAGGGKRAANMLEAQNEQFTRAVLRRVGENAPRATPQVIDGAFQRIGQTFDDLVKNTYVPVRSRVIRATKAIADDYEATTSAANHVPLVRKIATDLEALGSKGQVMSGQQYKTWRTQIEAAARGQKDPTTAKALRDLREVLDANVGGSLGKREQAMWKEARRQYRNMLVIERAAAGAGSNAAEGLISPSQLRNAVAQQSRRSYVRGQGDFANLARAGEAVLKPLPNSGTGPRAAATGLMQLGGTGLGALTGGGVGAVVGSIGALAGPAVASRTLMHPWTQAWLARQPAAGATTIAPRASIMRASPSALTAAQEADRRKKKDRDR